MSNLVAASRTAMFAAAYRARASAERVPICTDPWAAALVPEAEAMLTSFTAPVPAELGLGVAVRTAVIDDALHRLHASSNGIRQVVVLGAGFDSRAARFERPGLRFFEVDHPATQADKLERARRATNYPIDSASYVPCDIENSDFAPALAAAGFRRDERTLIVWEGVTGYLLEEGVRKTLCRVAESFDPASVIIFDYLAPETSPSGMTVEANRAGEPFRFLCPNILPIAYDVGFRFVRDFSAEQACLDLTGEYKPGRPLFRRWFITIASRTRAPEFA